LNRLEENFLPYRQRERKKERKKRLHVPILYSKMTLLNCFAFTVNLLYSSLFSQFPTFAELDGVTSNPEISPCHCLLYVYAA
jgi:hypothetical protein